MSPSTIKIESNRNFYRIIFVTILMVLKSYRILSEFIIIMLFMLFSHWWGFSEKSLTLILSSFIYLQSRICFRVVLDSTYIMQIRCLMCLIDAICRRTTCNYHHEQIFFSEVAEYNISYCTQHLISPGWQFTLMLSLFLFKFYVILLIREAATLQNACGYNPWAVDMAWLIHGVKGLYD